MPCYRSSGTIHVKISKGTSDDKPRCIYFIPDNDHSIKHENKRYGVFIGAESKSKIRKIKKGTIDLECNHEDIFSRCLEAASLQVGVELTVTENFNVVAVTIPARSFE